MAKITKNIDLEIALAENERLKKMIEAITETANKNLEELESLRFKYSLLARKKVVYNPVTGSSYPVIRRTTTQK